MQELIIRNVNTSEYESVNLNQYYDPNGEHKRAFEFQKSNIVSPYKSGEGKLTINFYTLQPGKVIIHITNILEEKKCFI